jgi:hypothetical protein
MAGLVVVSQYLVKAFVNCATGSTGHAVQSPRLSASAEDVPNTWDEHGKRLIYTSHLPNRIAHSGMHTMAFPWVDDSFKYFIFRCPERPLIFPIRSS